jgi:hypothetical protein
MIVNAGKTGAPVALNSNLAETFVKQTMVNAPSTSHVNTISSEFYNQNVENSKASPIPFTVNPGTVVVNTFGDVIDATKGKTVSVLATEGHAHGIQGATVGQFTDSNNSVWTVPGGGGGIAGHAGAPWKRIEGAYLNTRNAATVAQSWSDNISFSQNAVIVVQSCNLGNWTRMDAIGKGPSVPQTIADTTGHYVLTPGGYAGGQFIGPNGQYFGPAPSTNVLYSRDEKDTPHDYWHSSSEVAKAAKDGRVYNSMKNTYYLSFPKKTR